MEREKQVIVLLRALSTASFMLMWGPLGYDREWDDSSFRTRAANSVAHCSCAWLIIVTYRGLHNGVSTAFALRRDLSQVLRNLSGARAVHVAIFVVLIARNSWNMIPRSDEARLELTLTWLCAGSLPFSFMFVFAAMMASSALRELPDTSQTVQIRKKLQGFKQAMITHCFLSAATVLVLVLSVSLLLKYQMILGEIILCVCLLPGSVINLAKVLPHASNHSKGPSNKGKPRTIQIVPVLSTTKSLSEWQQEGKKSEDPYKTNVHSDVQAVGVLGVSLALLKKLAEENDIPADWTMTQVCAEVVKPQTFFQYETKQSRRSLSGKQVHCAYAALIGMATDNKGRPYVGKATRFLSYAW
jgi:hypothetical protein